MAARKSIWPLRCFAVLAALTICPEITNAECVRWIAAQKISKHRAGVRTVRVHSERYTTRSRWMCLSYVGSLEKNGVEHVLIKDETGTVHQLQLGSYMGENNGVIMKIDSTAIQIKQLIKRNGRLQEIDVIFTKRAPPEK